MKTGVGSSQPFTLMAGHSGVANVWGTHSGRGSKDRSSCPNQTGWPVLFVVQPTTIKLLVDKQWDEKV